MRSIILLILSFYLPSILTLYEDQIYKWDWRKTFLGINIQKCMLSSEMIFICAADESNILSALDINGDIIWRNIQETGARLIASAINDNNHLIGVSIQKSRSETKFYIRKWSTDRYGYSIQEKIILYNNIKNFHHCFSDINSKSSVVTLVCLQNDLEKIMISKISMKNEESKNEEKKWISLSANNFPTISEIPANCILSDSKALICISPTNSLTHFIIYYLILGENKWRVHFPNVQSNQKSSTSEDSQMKFTIETINNEKGHNNGFFFITATNLNKKDLYIFELVENEIKLKGTRNNANKVTALEDGNNFYISYQNESDIDIEVVSSDLIKQNMWKLNVDRTSHSASIHNFNVLQSSSTHIIICFNDQRLVSFSTNGVINWSQESSLSSVISSIFVPLPYSSSPTQYHASENINLHFITSFMDRIYLQVTALQAFIVKFFQDFSKPTSHKDSDDLDEVDGSELISDQFGFHKLIFTLTKSGKIIVLDTIRKGAIIWSLYDARLHDELIFESKRMQEIEEKKGRTCKQSLPIWVFFQKTSSLSPIITIITRKGYILSFNPLIGSLLDRTELNSTVKQCLLMHQTDENGVKGIIILDEHDKINYYPVSVRETFIAQKDNYYLMVGYPASDYLEGFSFNHLRKSDSEDKARRVWSLTLPSLTQSCLELCWREPNEHVHSQGKVLSDRSVLYKYLNPNLVLLVNEGMEIGEEGVNVVQVYLLDSITGAIYYSVVHKRATGPVNMIHSENFIVYSFYNEKQRRIEISSMELFEGKDTPAPPPVRIPPAIIEHISFVFPTGIKTMKETRTARGITNKHILIALSSGAILTLPKVFLDPRRASPSSSRYASSAAAIEEGGIYLPPYIPELPIPSEGIINYNQTLMGIRNINVGVSSLESTCLVFVTGLDMYYTRVTPSKTFDILKDDFDHLLIIVVLIVLLLFSLATKYLASRKTLKAAWK